MIRIFVEGIADVKFMTDYISHIVYGATVDIYKKSEGKVAHITMPENKEIEINSLDGWTNLQNRHNELKKNSKTLLIFDADKSDNNGGGYTERKTAIENILHGFDLTCPLFLFPNNQDDGALEDLLEQIIPIGNRPILNCWNAYERCLQSKSIDGRVKPLTTPARKTKIYGYLEALLDATNEDKKKIKESNREYLNADHWNLNVEYLNPLKEFLLQHLQ
jgi:hypothetical protein